MTTLTVDGKEYDCLEQETVLDALLRQDVEVNFACKKGTCQSCLLRSCDVIPPENSQAGLKDTQRHQKYFLSCQCVPEQDMGISLPEQSAMYAEGTVVVNEMLNHNTILLVVQCHDVLEYFPGQFVNLQRQDGLTRSYSIANALQQSNTLEFHIRRLEGGLFSEWVHEQLKVGDSIAVSEPKGHCFYIPEREDEGLLLVGTGTGLAPLAGILTDALQRGHSGPIHLFHGASVKEDLYRVEEMQELARQYANFFYTPCVSGDQVSEPYSAGRANDVALKQLPNLKSWRVFLCGHPDMVSGMKTQAFLKGASIDDIYTDAFVLSSAETSE